MRSSTFILLLVASIAALLACAAMTAEASSLPRPDKAAANKKKTRKASTPTPASDEEVDPRDDIIKYKGLLSCRACELMVDRLAVEHHTTPLPSAMDGVHDRRSRSKKQEVQLLTRNTEIMETVCEKMIGDAQRSGEASDVQMLQLHCDRIMGANERKFGAFLNTLAANASRIYVPVGEDKNDKTGRITPKFAFEHETDALCKKFCVEKHSMKDQMAKMQEEIKRKQRELMDDISLAEAFKEAFKLIASYWYISVPSIVILTALGLYVQIRFMAPRDDKGRPILGQQGFDSAYVAPKVGRGGKRLGSAAAPAAAEDKAKAE